LSKGRLRELHDLRRESLVVPSEGDASRVIRTCVRSLKMDSELRKALGGQFDLGKLLGGGGQSRKGRGKSRTGGARSTAESKKFSGRRFPSFFRLAQPSGSSESTPAARIPPGESRTVRFQTDVEDEYFSRSGEPGSLKFALVQYRKGASGRGSESEPKSTKGRTRPVEVNDVVDIERVGPDKGEIRLSIKPKGTLKVGDSVELLATMTGELTDLTELFWVRIIEPRSARRQEGEADLPGLPNVILVGRSRCEGDGVSVSWDEAFARGCQRNFDESVVVYPLMADGRVDAVFINMDSAVLERMRTERRGESEEQYRILTNQYIASMYLHTIVVCGGMSGAGYTMRKPDAEQKGAQSEVDLSDFVTDLFSGGYADFLLRFGSRSLLDALGE